MKMVEAKIVEKLEANGTRVTSASREILRAELKNFICFELSPMEQIFIILYYFEEIKKPDLAKLFGTNERRVDNRHQCILTKLRLRFRPFVAIN